MKKFLTIILFSVILCLSSNQAYAQGEKNIEYLNIDWWKNFKDEYLIENLLIMYENNHDLKNVSIKVLENEKLIKMQFAQELPFITLQGDLRRNLHSPREQFGSMKIPNYSQYNYYLPINVSYEADIYGINRLKTKMLKEELEITKEAQRGLYILLTSDFAADYFNLIKADKLLELQEEFVSLQEKILSQTTEKYKAGLCSINEVLFEEEYLTTLKEEKNRHKLIRDLLTESLKVYLSGDIKEIKRNNFNNILVMSDIPKELNSTIVENRPDFKQNEANIRLKGMDIKIAKREFLPKFGITGQIGLNAYNISSLFNSPSHIFNLGITPSFDIFAGGRKKAFLKFKKLEYEEAINDYQKTILEGIKEVNSGMLEYKTALKNYDESKMRLDTGIKIYNLAVDKNKIGTSSNIELLYAKEALLTNKKEEVSNKINSIIALIGLYKAAGGIDLYNANL